MDEEESSGGEKQTNLKAEPSEESQKKLAEPLLTQKPAIQKAEFEKARRLKKEISNKKHELSFDQNKDKASVDSQESEKDRQEREYKARVDEEVAKQQRAIDMARITSHPRYF